MAFRKLKSGSGSGLGFEFANLEPGPARMQEHGYATCCPNPDPNQIPDLTAICFRPCREFERFWKEHQSYGIIQVCIGHTFAFRAVEGVEWAMEAEWVRATEQVMAAEWFIGAEWVIGAEWAMDRVKVVIRVRTALGLACLRAAMASSGL